MPVTAIVLIVLAVALAAFGVAFAALGMSNERAYWSQRDPHGDPRRDATPFSTVARRAMHYASGEYRAPLRVVAIGVLMLWIAAACLVIGILVAVL